MPLDQYRQAGAAVDISPSVAAIKAEMVRQRDGGALPIPRTLSKAEWPPDYDAVYAWRRERLDRFEVDPKFLASAKRYYATHRIEFINHWIDTYDPRRLAQGLPVYMPFILFQRQQELCQFVDACVRAETSGLVEKTRDMGATWVCVSISVHWFLFVPASAIGWGSQQEDKVDRLGDPSCVFEKIRMALERLPDVFKPPNLRENLNFKRCVNPANGSTIVGEVGDNIGRGGRTTMYFVDEAAHLARPEKAEASLSDTTRCRIDISSVSGLGTVFHRKRENGVDWTPGQPAVRGKTNVFVMDWRDHPEKNEEWFEERRQKAEGDGLAHVFAQEVERNYAASTEGVIIRSEWVNAAIGADEKLGFTEIEGQRFAGLDVADSGGDTNAFVPRQGPRVLNLWEWSERDTGATTRRAIQCATESGGRLQIQYDANSVGAGVKGEVNRLADDKLVPAGIKFTPWMAGGKVQFPADFIVPGDRKSPRNKDFFQNLKAQAWWMVARRFERTFQAVNGTLAGDIDPDDLIFLPTSLPSGLLRKLQKELSQAIGTRKATTLKFIVDKAPEGVKSPNIADALVMAFWPVVVPEQRLAIGGVRVLRQP